MNKQNRLLVWVPLAVLLVGVMTGGSAAAQTGPVVERWIIGAGGDVSSGGDVTLHDTLGQPVGAAASSGGAVTMEVGYWQLRGPASIGDLRASVEDSLLDLQWTSVTLDVGGQTIDGVTYSVYRDQADPYFAPAVCHAEGLTDPTYPDQDADVVGNTTHGTYYVVRALYGGLFAEPSNRTGAFAFALVPGD